VWCKYYIPKQAHQKPCELIYRIWCIISFPFGHNFCFCFPVECEKCQRKLPLRPGTVNNNLPWGRCVECDAFIRPDFFYCQICAEPTDLGKSQERKMKAAQQSLEFKAKQRRQEVHDEWLLGSIAIPGSNLGANGQLGGGATNLGANGQLGGGATNLGANGQLGGGATNLGTNGQLGGGATNLGADGDGLI
jgi:hypothetical protein